MNKRSMIITGPVASRSGYGDRARDLVRSLITINEFDIKIIGTNWGKTPNTGLTESDTDITNLILNTIPENMPMPDIHIQITIPNEFRPIGRFNIGVTAGIETTMAAPSWIEGINRMDLTLVSSEFAKTTFMNSVYDIKDNNNNIVSSLKVEKPIEVLLEGVDLTKYTKEYNKSLKIESLMSSIPESFAFLFVGHWLGEDYETDRKNVEGLVKLFLETFKTKQNPPALILKTSLSNFSEPNKIAIQNRLTKILKTVTPIGKGRPLPSVYVIHGELTDSEMSDLYTHPKVKAHVSLTRGEGFGRPLAQAAISGKPIIVSGWSGHLDFLKPNFAFLVSGDIVKVPLKLCSENFMIAHSGWFDFNKFSAAKKLSDCFENYKESLEISRKSTKFIKDNFSMEVMQSNLKSILDLHLPKAPKVISVNPIETLKNFKLPKIDKDS